MVHLFKAYLVASDREFVSYIKLKKMEHEVCRNSLAPEELITLALNKFAILHKQNLWNMKSPEEERVITLTGKFQKLSDANLKLSKFLTEKKDKKGKSTDKGGKSKDKADNKWAWKKTPPKHGKPLKKKVNDKTYNWCKWHMAWLIDDPNATSGPTACKLRLSEGNNRNLSNPISNDQSDYRDTTDQVHATQALVIDLMNSLQQE